MNPVNDMHAALITYFSGEKRESLLFLMVGGAAIAISVYFWMTENPQRAMGYPLVAVALIQLLVGWTIWSRTDRQAKDLHTLLAKNPGAYVGAEVPRMVKVRKSFQIYKWIEILLLTAGAVGMLVWRERPTLHAVALGLALQSSLMLVFDLVAERRADIYFEHIRKLIR